MYYYRYTCRRKFMYTTTVVVVVGSSEGNGREKGKVTLV